MKKRSAFIFGILGLLMVLGLISFTSALCNQSQTIMQLSGINNAHGALWNQSYNIKICYNDVFIGSYSGDNPHECDSNDIILKLSDISNAHATGKESSAYEFPVCYKGLSDCKIGRVCAEDDATCNIVAYISGESNAHLSLNNYPGVGYQPISCSCREESCSKTTINIGPTGCYDYSNSDELSCSGDPYGVAQSDPGCSSEDKSLCQCKWDNSTNNCNVEWSIQNETTGCSYSCAVSGSEATQCSGNSRIIRNSALITSSDLTICPISGSPSTLNCKSGSATVPCGDLEANLPFFDSWQIIASVISITIVYGLMSKKRDS